MKPLSPVWRHLSLILAVSALPPALSRQAGADTDRGRVVLRDDFADLAVWRRARDFSRFGAVRRAPDGTGILVVGTDANHDAAVWRDVDVAGVRWLEVSVELMHGANTGAALLLRPLVADGEPGRLIRLFRIGAWKSTRWDAYRETVRVPKGVKRMRVLLSVLNGHVAFRNLELRETGKPRTGPRTRLVKGHGFHVDRFSVPRPVWEIHAADVDGDGADEVVACDVDGVLTVRRPVDGRCLLERDLGVLAYDIITCDLTGDGRPEILYSTLDKERSLEAIDLDGRRVARFASVTGPRPLAAADMDGDGKPEIAAGAGRMNGAVLIDAAGKTLWRTDDRVGPVLFARRKAGGPHALVVLYGGPRLRWWQVDAKGKARQVVLSDRTRLFNVAAAAMDADGDGTDEIVVLRGSHTTAHSLACVKGERILWSARMAQKMPGTFGSVLTGEFHAATPGPEIALVGSHVILLFDRTGVLLHQSTQRTTRGMGYMRQWDPTQLLIPDVTRSTGAPTRLWTASSRLRDPAVCRLTFGKKKPFAGDAPIPDDETHLDAIHQAAKKRPAAQRMVAQEKRFHVIYTRGFFANRDRAATRAIHQALKRLETGPLEYVLMYSASDLASHPRGTKLSTEQIVGHARWMEREGIPFGYFAVHGCEAWLSEKAIEQTLAAAPTAFRFVYAAEDFEGFYAAKSAGFLPWCSRMLDLLTPAGKKLILKEKHDAWSSVIADPAFSRVLFAPKHRGTLVPIWATNQPHQPESQLGGMLGLKLAGWVSEFGMSTQYWNWGEWRLRGVNLAQMAPADITMRLELMGAALGGTWLHIEGGQPYLTAPPDPKPDRLALRHRELVYELIRKGLLSPSPHLANVNRTAVSLGRHPHYAAVQKEHKRLKGVKAGASEAPLRRGFMPLRIMLEPWPAGAFASIAYGQRWHAETCFPCTPVGWVPVVIDSCRLPKPFATIATDAERVRLDGQWRPAPECADEVLTRLKKGAAGFALEAPGVCLIVHRLDAQGRRLRAFLIDPGYLAPKGVTTTLRARRGTLAAVTDAVTQKPAAHDARTCNVTVPRGAFRILDVQLR